MVGPPLLLCLLVQCGLVDTQGVVEGSRLVWEGNQLVEAGTRLVEEGIHQLVDILGIQLVEVHTQTVGYPSPQIQGRVGVEDLMPFLHCLVAEQKILSQKNFKSKMKC